MSRRVVLGLRQVLQRNCADHIVNNRPFFSRAAVLYQQTQPVLCVVDGVRSFAATPCCSQKAPASAFDIPNSESNLSSNSSSLQQPTSAQYNYTGRVAEPYAVASKPVFAVVEIGPTQFKVTPDDLVYSEKLKDVDVGDKLSLNRVLLLGNTATTLIGRPTVPGATVTAVVEVSVAGKAVICLSACAAYYVHLA